MRCLKCCECKLNLESELTCFSKDGSIYCKEDYYRYSLPSATSLGWGDLLAAPTLSKPRPEGTAEGIHGHMVPGGQAGGS